jgi:hypothetical protein
MNSIKEILDRQVQVHDDSAGKAEMSRLLIEKIIEKKKRQDEKFAFLFQLFVFLLLLVFLFFIFRFCVHIEEYHTITMVLVLGSTLLFTQVCQKFIGLLRR